MNISKLSMSNSCFGAKFYSDKLKDMAINALDESQKSPEKKEQVLNALSEINSLYTNGGIYLRNSGQVYFSPNFSNQREPLCKINVSNNNPNVPIDPIENITKIAEALKLYPKKS